MNNKKRHTIDVLFVITLFAVFAFSLVSLTGMGAEVYESIVSDMSSNYDSRTSFSYVYNKVHACDANGNVTLDTYQGLDALIILEEIDNITYGTYIYEYDGHLKELFTRYGSEFSPEYGTDILKIESFEIEKATDSLLKFSITPVDGAKETLFVHLHSVE